MSHIARAAPKPAAPPFGSLSPTRRRGEAKITPPHVVPFLDQTADALQSIERIPAAWGALLDGLRRLRDAAHTPDWHAAVRAHRLAVLLREEPATAWAFRRPRGRAGDARLLDYLYEHPSAVDDRAAWSARGRVMNAMLVSCAVAAALQERRRVLARLLDGAAGRVNGATGLVLGCGHMREIEFAHALDRFDAILGLDPEPASIATVQADYRAIANLRAEHASVADILAAVNDGPGFDVAYATSLYDVLDERRAAGLTARLFAALKPGGRLLLSSFCPGVLDYGYMDAVMDWPVAVRDEAALHRLIDGLPGTEIARATLFRGRNRVMVYALVERR